MYIHIFSHFVITVFSLFGFESSSFVEKKVAADDSRGSLLARFWCMGCGRCRSNIVVWSLACLVDHLLIRLFTLLTLNLKLLLNSLALSTHNLDNLIVKHVRMSARGLGRASCGV